MLVQSNTPAAKQWASFASLAARSPSPAERAVAADRAARLEARYGFAAVVLDSFAPPGAVLVDPHHVMVRGLPWWRAELINALSEGFDAEVFGDRWEPGFKACVVGELRFVLAFRALYAAGALSMALYLRRQAGDLRRRGIGAWERLACFAQTGFAYGLTADMRARRARLTPRTALILHPDPAAGPADEEPPRPAGVLSDYEKFFRTPDPFGIHRSAVALGKHAAAAAFPTLAAVLDQEPHHEREEADRPARLGGGAEPAPHRQLPR